MSNKILSGVVGKPILHSLSPIIFNTLYDLHNVENRIYSRFLVDKFEHFKELDRILGIDSFNITSPFKTNSKEFLEDIEKVKDFNEDYNFLYTTKHKRLALNTDKFAVSKIIEETIVNSIGRKILIIGAGSSAKSAILAISDAEIYVANRSKSRLDELAKYYKFQKLTLDDCLQSINKFDFIINTIDNFDFLDQLVKVHPDTKILNSVYSIEKYFTNFPTNLISGKTWLIYQAIPAYQLQTNIEVKYKTIDNILTDSQPININNRIYLSGFMGAEKSTIGKLLSKQSAYNFFDLDNLIKVKTGKKISTIFAESGENYFRNIESQILKEFAFPPKSIIALGGGTLVSFENRSFVKSTGINILLIRNLHKSFNKIKTSERPNLLDKNIESFSELFQQRRDSYVSNADLIVYNDNLELTVSIILNEIHKNQ